MAAAFSFALRTTYAELVEAMSAMDGHYQIKRHTGSDESRLFYYLFKTYSIKSAPCQNSRWIETLRT